MTFPDVRTSGRPSVPFWLKFFCLLISQLVFIGLLLYFTYSFLKTLAIFFYCKFRRFRLRIFYKTLVFGDFWLKFFEYIDISVTINGIAFIFYIQLPKDLGKTFPRYFCILILGVSDLEFFTKFWCFEIIG